MVESLQPSSAAEWVSAAIAGLTLLFAAPASFFFLSDRKIARDAKLTITPQSGSFGLIYVRLDYRADEPSQAITARLVATGHVWRLSTDVNGATLYDVSSSTVVGRNPGLATAHSVILKLYPGHGDPTLFSGTVVAAGDVAHSLKLDVLISTWPDARHLARQRRTISAHL